MKRIDALIATQKKLDTRHKNWPESNLIYPAPRLVLHQEWLCRLDIPTLDLTNVGANCTRYCYLTTIPANCTWQLYVPANCTWQLYLTTVPDNYTCKLYLTTIPNKCTWQLYLQVVPDSYTWQIYLTTVLLPCSPEGEGSGANSPGTPEQGEKLDGKAPL